MLQDSNFRQFCFYCQFFELIQIQNQEQGLSVDPLDPDDLDRVAVADLARVLSLVLPRRYQDLLFQAVVQLFVIVRLVELKPITRHVQHLHLENLRQLRQGLVLVDAEDHLWDQLVVLVDQAVLAQVVARAVHPSEVVAVHPLVDVVHHPLEVLADLIHLVALAVLAQLVVQAVLVLLVG